MSMTLAIVGCSKEKVWDVPGLTVPSTVPARLAYVGPFHRRSMHYAELVAPEIWILSAKYGFLFSGDPVSNYDVTWRDASAVDRQCLYRQAELRLAQRTIPTISRVLVIAGASYVARVVWAFSSFPAVEVVPVLQIEKLAGIGHQLRWLNEQIRQLRSEKEARA